VGNNRLGIIIQARMNSSRLPGKVLKPICGKPMLMYLIERLRTRFDESTSIDIIAVATSVEIYDNPIAELCLKENIQFLRGSERNVFQRYKLAIQKWNLDIVVRLTADNPLVSMDLIEKSINQHNNLRYNITSTRTIDKNKRIKRYSPKGHTVDVLNCQYLKKVSEQQLTDFDMEHVIPPFYEDRKKVNIVRNTNPNLIESTIDTIEDFDRILILINRKNISSHDMV